MNPLRILTVAATLAIFAWCLPPAHAQEWNQLLKGFAGPFTFDGLEVDAPDGFQVLNGPDGGSQVLREVAGPTTVRVSQYIETRDDRFYLTPESSELLFDNPQALTWIRIKGTQRHAFIAGTDPGKFIKKETRDFFKTGPETADIYEERVPLDPASSWEPTTRRGELDFLLPLKVISFEANSDGSWRAEFNVFPNFNSQTDRIPGPSPELYGEPHQVLITSPKSESHVLTGTVNGGPLQQVLLPGTVWAGGFNEGRLHYLRLGFVDLPHQNVASHLSPAHFTEENGRLVFQFAATRLSDPPITFTVTPDLILGADYNEYDVLAELGGPFGPPAEDIVFETYLQQQWNIEIRPDQQLRVIAPLLEGRGAEGIIELEGIALETEISYEALLASLAQLNPKGNGPVPQPALSAPWKSILKHKLGSIPSQQRAPEVTLY